MADTCVWKEYRKGKLVPVCGGGRSSMVCPVCISGTLRYSVAALNGHMHGACSTEGCVRWME